jgi:DNA/RNA-binding domain of Phe-tRNA-synthetase-like protein
MTRLSVRDEACRAFPGLRIVAIVALGFDGRHPWPEVAAELAALEAGAAADPDLAGQDDPHIAAWHEAYRAFGTNPRRQRPSADALRRRLARSGRLPRINPAVDGYNLVSARYAVPAGAFDLSRVRGDIAVGFASGSEDFTPLGEPDAVEHPHPGEVIYTDAAGVLTRHWNHRDADRTKVTEDSEQIVFLLETVDAEAFGARLDDARDSLIRLLSSRSRAVLCHEITASRPQIPALVPAEPGPQSGAGVDVDLRAGA